MTACDRSIALTFDSNSAARSFDAVMSVANLTTFTTRPSSSRIGL